MPRSYTPKVESACTQCGTIRLYRPCEVTKFCSHACYVTSRTGVHRIPKETRTCTPCGRSFTTRATLPTQYCSKACADTAKLQPVAARFWSKVDRSTASGCWYWKAGIGTDGYGKFWIAGRSVHAHTIAYQLTYGDPPAGYAICHHCDTRPCCRPDHLFAGTNQQNMQDMIQKGRGGQGDRHWSRVKPERIPRGSAHHQAKLTEAIVRTIRFERANYHTPFTVFSRRYGVTPPVIRNAAVGRTWKHVTN